MRILDLLRMSSANLWKRKVRTLLTILGVVIGTASIVVMVSLGLGLNKATMEDIEQYGGLTTIEVREGRGDSSSIPRTHRRRRVCDIFFGFRKFVLKG